MNQGCLLVAPESIAQPDIFDAIADVFTIIRHLEADERNHILVVEHPKLKDVNEGFELPFYDVEFSRKDGEIVLSSISEPFYHQNYKVQCQSKKETNTSSLEDREEKRENLIWMP